MTRRVNRAPRAWGVVVALSSFVSSCSLVACSPDAEPGDGSRAATEVQLPRIVLLVSVDTLRADHLGCYGYPRFTSPSLDVLATEGVLFEDASSTSPWTLPAHASLLTGRYPLDHGVMTMRTRLPDSIPTLAALFRDAGFETAAVVNSTWLERESFQLTRDFERYRFAQENAEQRGPSTWVSDQALEWIDETEGRLFLFVHYYDVHADYASQPAYEQLFREPYDGIADGTAWQLTRAGLDEEHLAMCREDFDPAKCRFGSAQNPQRIDHEVTRIELGPEDARHLVNLYDAGVRQMDAELGRFFSGLRERGLLDETLLVVTSDHGEEFLEHGHVDHFLPLWQELVHVPLLMRGPSLPAGVRVSEPVSTVDVAPTLLSLAGVPIPEAMKGDDLSRLWSAPPEDRAGLEERVLFGEAAGGLTYRVILGDFYPLYRSVRRGPYKLVWKSHGGEESSRLYDLDADPGEQHDVADRLPDVARDLRALLDARFSNFEGDLGEENRIRLPEEDSARLRALGYMQ